MVKAGRKFAKLETSSATGPFIERSWAYFEQIRHYPWNRNSPQSRHDPLGGRQVQWRYLGILFELHKP